MKQNKSVRVSEALHRKLKILAAKTGMSASEVAELALTAFFETKKHKNDKISG